ncbi:MAG: ferredoxin:glutaredoxin reductase [Chloroflexi bacterium]|nr:ferredoxin:glutaredoxin reductase [Chloroflexota bacterium]
MSGHSEQARRLRERLKREAEAAGYFINPDTDFVLDLMQGLLTNEARLGYWACPCRLADGVRENDLDIICPCDYRDPDLEEYGACYCALYVSEAIALGQAKARSVPERRGSRPQAAPAERHAEELVGFTAAGLPVWRCKVCGYLCARPQPPLKCPICKADKDRFERFP